MGDDVESMSEEQLERRKNLLDEFSKNQYAIQYLVVIK